MKTALFTLHFYLFSFSSRPFWGIMRTGQCFATEADSRPECYRLAPTK
jgi:hypothetical protein